MTSNLPEKPVGDNPHRDPLTGESGAHPVGTGVGAASGATAGAAVGAIGGPVTTAVGVVVGAVAGGIAGKIVAEALDPTVEDLLEHQHRGADLRGSDAPYVVHQSAYRIGYEGRLQHRGKEFEEVESILQRAYDESLGSSPVSWEEAKSAARNGWNHSEATRGVITTGRKS